ncbi:LacI family DNA-binding transcriptional regulator [Oscillospiraceae bacterium PP1C4]
MNIYDIAKQSNVSIATVSRVINGSVKVSEKTRQKVLDVMQEEGYTPNVFARGLGLNSMKMIGILCTDVSDIFFAKAVSLVEQKLRHCGFDSLLCCTGNLLEDKKKAIGLLLDKRVDAILLIGSPFKDDVDNSYIEKAANNVPVIIINGYIEASNIYSVYCDCREAMNKNVKLLYRQGHERILYLYDVLTFAGREKMKGYQCALEECGLPFDQRLLVQVESDLEKVTQKVGELVRSGLDFSAVVAPHDLIAIGAQKALQDFGETYAIIGFNNSILAKCATPALTSVDIMLETLCPTAVGLLVDLLGGKTVPQKSVISARLVERETFRFASREAQKE